MNHFVLTALIVAAFTLPILIGVYFSRKMIRIPNFNELSKHKWRVVMRNGPYSFLGHYKYRWLGKNLIAANNEMRQMADELNTTSLLLSLRMLTIDVVWITMLIMFVDSDFYPVIMVILIILFWIAFSFIFIGFTTRNTGIPPEVPDRHS